MRSVRKRILGVEKRDVSNRILGGGVKFFGVLWRKVVRTYL